jgi:hypothetical protein
MPQSISNKIAANLELTKDGKSQIGSRFQGKQGTGKELKGVRKSEIITNRVKNNSQWQARNGVDFAEVFYKNQPQCPKTRDGNIICIMYFTRGFCDKTCT